MKTLIKLLVFFVLAICLFSQNISASEKIKIGLIVPLTGMQPLTMYKADIKKDFNYLRIKPLNKFGAPARGATVILNSNLRKHAKTIDAGSGYLCQMEPVAHYGIREGEKNISIDVVWTNGLLETFNVNELNKIIEIRQK